MGSIWNDIVLTWKEKEYRVKPTIDFINRLEQNRGCSLTNILLRTSKQDLPSSVAVTIISETLKYAGAGNVTPEEIFKACGGTSDTMVDMALTIVTACLPSDDEEGTNNAGTIKKKTTTRKRKA